MKWLGQDHLANNITGTGNGSVHFSAAVTKYSVYLRHCARHKSTLINSVPSPHPTLASLSSSSLAWTEWREQYRCLGNTHILNTSAFPWVGWPVPLLPWSSLLSQTLLDSSRSTWLLTWQDTKSLIQTTVLPLNVWSLSNLGNLLMLRVLIRKAQIINSISF